MKAQPTIRLHNGIEMPQVGLGVWQAAEGREVVEAVGVALRVGYRSIDTAKIYGNEAGVGRAIRESGVPREEIFVTTKLWNDDQGYDSTLRAFDDSLARLKMDCIDLYLIHWPGSSQGFIDSWRAFERLYSEGRVRAIGVSNFDSTDLRILVDHASVVPMVNQIELHPYRQQHKIRECCERRDIRVESYSPLMRAGDVMDEPAVVDAAGSLGKTPFQVVLRWHVQQGLIVIPKSVNPERIAENFAIFDFELSSEQMKAIDELDRA